MTKYTALLFHDKGRFSMTVNARNWKQAVKSICSSENCPESAIKKMVKWVSKSKVIPVKLQRSLI